MGSFQDIKLGGEWGGGANNIAGGTPQSNDGTKLNIFLTIQTRLAKMLRIEFRVLLEHWNTKGMFSSNLKTEDNQPALAHTSI